MTLEISFLDILQFPQVNKYPTISKEEIIGVMLKQLGGEKT